MSLLLLSFFVFKLWFTLLYDSEYLLYFLEKSLAHVCLNMEPTHVHWKYRDKNKQINETNINWTIKFSPTHKHPTEMGRICEKNGNNFDLFLGLEFDFSNHLWIFLLLVSCWLVFTLIYIYIYIYIHPKQL